MASAHANADAGAARIAERRAWLLTSLLALGCLPAVSAGGQGRVIGQIQRIRATAGQQSCRPQGAVPGSVRLVRGRAPRELGAVPPPEQLQLDDSIRVGGDFDARLTINDTTYGYGEIVLAPRLFCAVIGADLERGLPADTGIYSLSRRGDSLRFTVHRGGAFITWTDRRRLCRLQVGATDPGNPVRVCGTTLIVAVDASGRRGVVHLVEGAIRLGALTVQAGDVVTLGSGEAVTIVPRQRSSTLIDQAHVDFHSRLVWEGVTTPPPGRPPSALARALRNPWTYVVLAGVGAGAWCAVERCWEGDQPSLPSRRSRTIIVRIPI